MARAFTALALTALVLAGCGSSSSGGSGESSGGGSGGPLTEDSSCYDWNQATLAQRKAFAAKYTKGASQNVYGFLRDTCEPITEKASASAIKLGPTVQSVAPSG
jgi:hypothetical protein